MMTGMRDFLPTRMRMRTRRVKLMETSMSLKTRTKSLNEE